ncbi:DNA-binding response regulator [Thalassotalea euphylliae]|uniref:DNA-binding response regulator n=1 Tax=Thalassotalea euphylliae TaxID=1655234 RepID=A0A3E0TUF1_9GAMM|nr:response regulator transcription factor [Thalassotalea euphylliae]REL28198.1 DNA-binding response regulator [Thalassotalea euphylliae]
MIKKAIKLLLIEDNHTIATQITSFLENHGWQVDFAATGRQGIDLALSEYFDVVILDLNLPDIDGLEVCEQIKANSNHNPPILMLTARDAFEDKARGFGRGADDYLTKPFDFRELALRCEAMARRPKLHENTIVAQGQLHLNIRAFEAKWGKQPIKLTKVGFTILHKLLKEYPYPVSRSELSMHIWGDEPPQSNALKSHIYALRKSLESSVDKPILHTISNIGYQLKDLDV